MIIDNKIVKLFMPVFFGFVIFHNCIGMDQGVREQKVVHLATNNNPEPEVIALRRLGLAMGSIRTLKQSDYEVAQQLHIFLKKFNTQDPEIIKYGLEDFNEVCKRSSVNIEPYLSDILKSVIKKRDVVLQETNQDDSGFDFEPNTNWSLVKERKEKLSNLYKIYNLLTQYGAKNSEESRFQAKRKFEFYGDEDWMLNFHLDIKRYLDETLVIYKKYGLATEEKSEKFYRHTIIFKYPGLLYHILDLKWFTGEKNKRFVLEDLFDRVSYFHPEYLKKLTPKVARQANLSLMPDEDKNLIGLFEFLFYQLDIFKRPENMQSLFDENFDISKFASNSELNRVGSSEDTEIQDN